MNCDLQFLAAAGVPAVMLQLLELLDPFCKDSLRKRRQVHALIRTCKYVACYPCQDRNLEVVEFFGGILAVLRAFKSLGYRSAATLPYQPNHTLIVVATFSRHACQFAWQVHM